MVSPRRNRRRPSGDRRDEASAHGYARERYPDSAHQSPADRRKEPRDRSSLLQPERAAPPGPWREPQRQFQRGPERRRGPQPGPEQAHTLILGRGPKPRASVMPGRRVLTGRAARIGAVVLGAALAVGGSVAVVRAISAGQDGQLTGAATQIPATVQTSVPQPMTEPTAAPLAASVPVRIEIPSLHVDAPVMRLGEGPDGTVQVPPLDNHNLAGWYDHSVTPGQRGTSIILGHVDTVAGPSVFFYIKTLNRGDIIKVLRANGSTAVFSVDGVQRVAKATFPSAEVYGNTRYPGLRLITCGGPFDTATRQYLDNIVVYSHLIS
jgi:sortase (surface protein transpeptidase)